MTERGRVAMFLCGGALVALLLGWALGGLPPFGGHQGPYGLLVDRLVPARRHVASVVAAVTLDVRGFDTLFEESILFAAVVGVTILLRPRPGEELEPPDDGAQDRAGAAVGDAERLIGLALVAPTAVVGIDVIAHGHLSPGGGFQGGAVLAGAFLLVYLASSYRDFERIRPVAAFDAGEGGGVAAYVVVGLIGLGMGSAFLENVFPLGERGALLSGGTVPVLNVAVGAAVCSGIVLLLTAFLEQALRIRGGRR